MGYILEPSLGTGSARSFFLQPLVSLMGSEFPMPIPKQQSETSLCPRSVLGAMLWGGS